MQTLTGYVFLAGGIGVTPFRSMIAHSLVKKEKLNTIFFHFASSQDELLFQDIFTKAEDELGLTYLPIVGERFSGEMLVDHVTDTEKRLYYLSGSEHFINAVREVLYSSGVQDEQIKTDIFSGY